MEPGSECHNCLRPRSNKWAKRTKPEAFFMLVCSKFSRIIKTYRGGGGHPPRGSKSRGEERAFRKLSTVRRLTASEYEEKIHEVLPSARGAHKVMMMIGSRGRGDCTWLQTTANATWFVSSELKMLEQIIGCMKTSAIGTSGSTSRSFFFTDMSSVPRDDIQ